MNQKEIHRILLSLKTYFQVKFHGLLEYSFLEFEMMRKKYGLDCDHKKDLQIHPPIHDFNYSILYHFLSPLFFPFDEITNMQLKWYTRCILLIIYYFNVLFEVFLVSLPMLRMIEQFCILDYMCDWQLVFVTNSLFTCCFTTFSYVCSLI